MDRPDNTEDSIVTSIIAQTRSSSFWGTVAAIVGAIATVVGAILLLAIAFARPFLRSQSVLGVSGSQGRRMILLVDTSASMQRQGTWSAAMQRSEELLADLGPRDWVALYAFDSDVRVIVDFPRDVATPISQHRQQISVH